MKEGEREEREIAVEESCLAAYKWEINTSASLMLPGFWCLLAGNFNDVGLSQQGAWLNLIRPIK